MIYIAIFAALMIVAAGLNEIEKQEFIDYWYGEDED